MNIFSDEMIKALRQTEVMLIYAVRLDFPQGVERLHTDIGTFNHMPFDLGESYRGVGNLGGIGDVTYGDGDDTTPSITLELSIKDDQARNQMLAGGYQGRKGELYLVVMDKVGHVLASSLQFDGIMDSATIKQGSENTIQLPLTAPDDALDKGLNWRCTDESHQARHKGDRFYKYTVYMEDLILYWGNKKDGIPLGQK